MALSSTGVVLAVCVVISDELLHFLFVLFTHEYVSLAEESVCPPPPQVFGAQQTTVGRNYRNGSKAAFSCHDGFQLVGTREITCIEGQWQSPPHCVGQYWHTSFPSFYYECDS